MQYAFHGVYLRLICTSFCNADSRFPLPSPALSPGPAPFPEPPVPAFVGGLFGGTAGGGGGAAGAHAPGIAGGDATAGLLTFVGGPVGSERGLVLKGFENTLFGFLSFAESSDFPFVVDVAGVGMGCEHAGGAGAFAGLFVGTTGLGWPFEPDAEGRRRFGSRSGSSILDR